MTTLPAGWKPIPASLYDLILTGDLESLLWKLKGVHEAEEVRMALYNARQAILASEEYSDCTPPATTQNGPITVSLDPDPRGVSVGVWQGSRCIYNGAHAVPVSAQDDAKDGDCDIPELRSQAEIGFEEWLTRQMPKGTVISNPAWWAPRILSAAMRSVRAKDHLVAVPAADDARDAARLDWLEQHDGRFFNKDRISSIVGVGFLVAGDPQGVRHQTVRSAIDAAIAASQQQEG